MPLNGDQRRLLDDERQQVAATLHDDAIQVMFGAAFLIEALVRRQTDPELVAELRGIAADLSAAGERLNQLMRDLQRPSTGR